MIKKLFVSIVLVSSVYGHTISHLSCQEISLDTFVADYEISTSKKDTVVRYYRLDNRIAYEYKDQKITEIWEKSTNNQAQLIRAFDKDKRSIEYDPIDVRMEKQSSSWDIHKNLANPKLFNLKNPQVLQIGSCRYEHYEEIIDGKKIIMDYEANNNILISLKVKKLNIMLYSYKLKDIKGINKKVNHVKTAISYDSTDFADIGDNESDPFFTKMITLGFVTYKY